MHDQSDVILHHSLLAEMDRGQTDSLGETTLLRAEKEGAKSRAKLVRQLED